HRQKKADITLATIPVTAHDAPGFGILTTNDAGTITEFYGKPAFDQLGGKESPVSPEMESADRTYLASMRTYVFDRDLLASLLDDDPSANDFGEQLIPNAIHMLQVVSYPFEGYWSDIGTIRSFYEAIRMLTKPKPEFKMF